MSKILYIKDKGYVWTIPTMPIVLNRADYYASIEKSRDGDYNEVFKQEIRSVQDDPVEILDWFLSNMDMHDMAAYFKLVESPPVPKYPGDEAEVTFDR